MCPYIVIFCQKADLKRFCCLSPLYPITVCILFVIGYSGDNKLASDLLYLSKYHNLSTFQAPVESVGGGGGGVGVEMGGDERQCRTQVTRLTLVKHVKGCIQYRNVCKISSLRSKPQPVGLTTAVG